MLTMICVGGVESDHRMSDRLFFTKYFASSILFPFAKILSEIELNQIWRKGLTILLKFDNPLDIKKAPH